MSSSAEPLLAALVGPAPEPARREPRERTVRLVEYTAFPRVDTDAERHTGFTRDLSASGLCIAAERLERPDTLLRLTLRGLDGCARRPLVGRVVWCRQEGADRFWIGIERIPRAGSR